MRALGDDHDRRVPGLEPVLDVGADLLDVERALRDEDHVGAAGEARVQRDPARVAAHHLDDQRPVMALGRGVQPVDRLHGDVHRRIEAEGEVGRAEVVVDRLGHPDDGNALLAEPGATPSVSSPPMAMSASTPRPARLSLIRSTPVRPRPSCS